MTINKKISACIGAIAIASTLFTSVNASTVAITPATKAQNSNIKDPFENDWYQSWCCSLNKSYTQMTGTLFINKSCKLKLAKLYFYNDNKCIASYTLKAGSSPIQVNLNVRGVERLEIRTKNIPLTSGWQNNGKLIKISLKTDMPDLKTEIGKFTVK